MKEEERGEAVVGLRIWKKAGERSRKVGRLRRGLSSLLSEASTAPSLSSHTLISAVLTPLARIPSPPPLCSPHALSMDRDNRPNNNGFFHHLLDPHLGEAIGNLVRGLLPQHQPQPQPADQSLPASSGAQDASALPLPESTIHTSHLGTTDIGAPSGSRTDTSVRSTVSPVHLRVSDE